MDRIVYIDYLRNLANIVRCFIHASVPYMITFAPMWPIDDDGTWFFDFAIFESHLFVMELFFVISGYLFAFELLNKSPIQVIKNRFNRIVIPFILGLIIIIPLILSYFELGKYSANQFNLELFKRSYIRGWELGFENFFPTGHLWFLYYLILFYIITLVFRKSILKMKSHSLRTILCLGILISMICMYFMKRWVVDNPITLAPEIPSFIHYLCFFIIGVLILRHLELLKQIKKYSKPLLIIGSFMGVMALIPQLYFKRIDLEYYGLIKFAGICFSNISIYFLVFGIWGLFGKMNLKNTSKLRYLTDSSYWVYLSNMPIVMFIHILLVDIDIPVVFKFLIAFSSAFLVSIVSYEYLVRYTIIGKLLNKKRTRA